MNILKGLLFQLRLTGRLIMDPRVPFYLKIIPFLGLIYVISPIDLIPDILIGIGQLDDLGVILAGVRMFQTLTPAYLVDEHRATLQMIDRGEKPKIMQSKRYRITPKAKR